MAPAAALNSPPSVPPGAGSKRLGSVLASLTSAFRHQHQGSLPAEDAYGNEPDIVTQ